MFRPGKRIELAFLAGLPSFVTALLAIFCMASKHIGGLDYFTPALYMAPIFYWGIAQARDMPYWFVFILGVVMDSITGLPLGISSLTYVFFLMLIHTQRKYIHKEGFVIKWGFFAVLLAVADIANWLLLAFFYSHAQVVAPALVQWLLTVCCYPVMHKICDGVYGYVHARRWQVLHGR